jgi:hypothetical protein
LEHQLLVNAVDSRLFLRRVVAPEAEFDVVAVVLAIARSEPSVAAFHGDCRHSSRIDGRRA